MTTLLLILAPIALLDSTSIVPLCIVPLAAVLGGNRPVLGAIGFLGGIFVVYVAGGFVLLLGLDAVFDALGPGLERRWNDPNTPELFFKIVVGAVMLAFAWKLASSRESGGERGHRLRSRPAKASPWGPASRWSVCRAPCPTSGPSIKSSVPTSESRPPASRFSSITWSFCCRLLLFRFLPQGAGAFAH